MSPAILILISVGSLLLGIIVGALLFPRKYIIEVPVLPKPQFQGFIFINNFQIKGDNLMTKVPFNALSTEIQFGPPVDAKGNAATLDGNSTITSSDDSVLTVEASEIEPENPYRAKVNFTGKAGAAQVLISGDADLGEGIKTLTGAETFEVPAGEAVSFGAAVVGDFKMPEGQ